MRHSPLKFTISNSFPANRPGNEFFCLTDIAYDGQLAKCSGAGEDARRYTYPAGGVRLKSKARLAIYIRTIAKWILQQ